MVCQFGVPPFIVTLAVMLMASGAAYIVSDTKSIYELPKAFDRLGVGTTAGLPNTVILMLVLYVLAHVLMSRTSLGRYIYAVGGNEEAARLSGVPVRRVILFVYTVTGLLAGLAGIITASKLKSGAPQYGLQTELEVIAAVVVGGTSLMGGSGRIMGTLVGAFIIGVMGNGLNLMGVDSSWQKVALGAVILGAVLIDGFKKRWA
jgi:ribose transport system permease protein